MSAISCFDAYFRRTCLVIFNDFLKKCIFDHQEKKLELNSFRYKLWIKSLIALVDQNSYANIYVTSRVHIAKVRLVHLDLIIFGDKR